MAGADKNWNKKLVLFGLETTEATDALTAADAANAFQVLNYQPTFMTADGRTRAIEKAFFGADPTTMGNVRRGATFDMEMTGSGDPTKAPAWMTIAQLCGMGLPTAAASTMVQKPVTDAIRSASHYAYIDDLLLKALGVRGGLGFTIENGNFPFLSFNVLGFPPPVLAQQQVPPALAATGYVDPVTAETGNTTISFGGYFFGVRSLVMSDNVTLSPRALINPQSRMKYAGRSWSGTLILKVPDITVANANPFAGIREGMKRAARVVHGTAAGNIVQIDMPALQVSGDVTLSNEDGELMASMPVTALPVSGNDEVVFTTK